MPRRRFYIPRESIQDGVAVLPSDQAHHLRNVLRLKTGDSVEIFDGEGRAYTGDVELHGSEVRIGRLQSLSSMQSRGHLILAAALIKSARFEWVLQKATELGVAEIIPLSTSRSGVRLTGRGVDSRLDRWDRILKEAAKQCRRMDAPRLHKPLDFSGFLRLEELSCCAKFFFYEKSPDLWQPAKSCLSEKTVLCVGPEGGWDSLEIEQAVAAGYEAFSLGPWILRAETAAIAAVAILQHQIHLHRN